MSEYTEICTDRIIFNNEELFFSETQYFSY